LLAINFFSEDVSFSLPKPAVTSAWIVNVLNHENAKAENINYVFCSDDHLLNINKKYLNHDYMTDIITFDNSEQHKLIEADIYISIDRVKENASQLKKTFKDELDRVMIHGVLHLLGYNDKTEDEIIEMRKKEDASLSLR